MIEDSLLKRAAQESETLRVALVRQEHALAAQTQPVAVCNELHELPITARRGRADDFSWPRGAANVEPGAVEPTAADTTVPDVGAKSAKPAQRRSAMDAYASQTSRQKPAQRRPRSRPNPDPPFFGFFR